MCGIHHKRKTLVLTLASPSLTKVKKGWAGVQKRGAITLAFYYPIRFICVTWEQGKQDWGGGVKLGALPFKVMRALIQPRLQKVKKLFGTKIDFLAKKNIKFTIAVLDTYF
jgi:hypothetical protein